MTANKRIALNVAATYGRSLYTLVVGLFCGRWTLMMLGQTDYGLMGLVGGLTGFITFFNGILAGSIGRYYGFYIGKAKADSSGNGLEECRRWFSLAVLIHSLVPMVLIVIGYPVGVWAVRNFLTIPPDRVEACVWVFRFVCASCFVGMINVPFQAMYSAKQEIAELTIYSFVTTTANFVFLYFAVSNPGDWLVKFMLWTAFLSIAPQLIICWRAVVKYPECRLRRDYLWDWERFKQILGYAAARFWTTFTDMFATQCKSILVNKYLGPKCNAAMAIGGSVSGHAMTFSSALSNAFWPAIVNKAGEGDEVTMRKMAFLACRLGTVMVMLFAIPLALEVDEVLVLWLKNPPEFAGMLCIAAMLCLALERTTEGYWMVILGAGKGVKKYSLVIGWSAVVSILVVLTFFLLGMGFWSIFWGGVAWGAMVMGLRLWLGSSIVDLSFKTWFKTVFAPLLVVVVVSLGAGIIPRFYLNASFVRVAVTTAACEVVFLPMTWLLVFDKEERDFVYEKLSNKIPWLKGFRK